MTRLLPLDRANTTGTGWPPADTVTFDATEVMFSGSSNPNVMSAFTGRSLSLSRGLCDEQPRRVRVCGVTGRELGRHLIDQVVAGDVLDTCRKNGRVAAKDREKGIGDECGGDAARVYLDHAGRAFSPFVLSTR